jgi:2'-5' RNA ligase
MKNFFAAAETREHPWPAGRRDLHWHLLPPDAEQGRAALQDGYEALIGAPGLVPVMPQWLHVTVLHSGPAEDASEQELGDIIAEVRAEVRARGTAPVELTFARPSVGTVAVERAARPGAAARALWQATWNATCRVVGPDRWPPLPRTYYPHVTLAYAGLEASLADRNVLKSLLSDCTGDEVKLTFPELALVSQRHNGHSITWQTITTVPLGC